MFEIETEGQINNLLNAYTKSTSEINHTEILEKSSELEIFLSQETKDYSKKKTIYPFKIKEILPEHKK